MEKHAPNVWVPREFYTTRFRLASAPERWPAQFTIVTAWAPTGESWPEERNLAADEALRRILEAGGRWHHRITGYDPAGNHAEPGWAIEQSLEEGVGLASRFQQLAIYVVSGGELRVVMCERPGEPSRVAWFADRLDDPPAPGSGGA